MTSRIAAAFLVALGLAVVALMRWRAALPSIRLAPRSMPALVKSPTGVADSVLEDLAATLVENDPFRVANAPAAVRFDARVDGATGSAGTSGGAVPVAAPAPVRPSFALRAIVGGPPWQAIIDGFPGKGAGVIVQKGNVIDRITVTSVTRDSVALRGPDTAWVLTFRRRE